MVADVIVVLFVLAFVWFGYKAGVLKTLVGFFSYFAAVIISAVINPSVSAFIRKTFVADFVYKFVLEKVQKNELPKSGMFSKFSNMLAEEAANYVSVFLINIIAFVATIVICRLILYFITKAVKIVSHFPVISTVNRICGGILGGFESIIVLYIISLILMFLPAGEKSVVINEIENSQIAKSFYTENIISDVLGKEVLNLEQK